MALATEAQGWLRENGVALPGPDEHARWTRRFATSLRPGIADAFLAGEHGSSADVYPDASFVQDDASSELRIDTVACNSRSTRLTWSRAQTSAEEALADADCESRDDVETMYLPLESGGGSDGGGRYEAFSRFAPAVPGEATELHFRAGASMRARREGASARLCATGHDRGMAPRSVGALASAEQPRALADFADDASPSRASSWRRDTICGPSGFRLRG